MPLASGHRHGNGVRAWVAWVMSSRDGSGRGRIPLGMDHGVTQRNLISQQEGRVIFESNVASVCRMDCFELKKNKLFIGVGIESLDGFLALDSY